MLTLLITIALSCPSEPLLDAIREVESSGGVNLVGDSGRAIGPYQIWPITVRDCNRILRKDVFSLDDRWDEAKSREMCRIILSHYCDDGDNEAMARRWRGGTKYQHTPETDRYWEKIKAVLDQ